MKADTAPAVVAPRDWSTQPSYVFPMYKSTQLRGPKQALVPMKHTLANRNAPVYAFAQMDKYDNDLTMNARVNGEPLGERIIVTGRVLDEDGRPVRNTLVEVWQANASGRYHHPRDQHDAPLDPNFEGRARIFTANRCSTPISCARSPSPVSMRAWASA
jgi:protocatechuate 3,4-dioxygenase beta subunit